MTLFSVPFFNFVLNEMKQSASEITSTNFLVILVSTRTLNIPVVYECISVVPGAQHNSWKGNRCTLFSVNDASS